ncbi:MAG: nucleotidyltransferase domain-containing protein [Anaerolineae bacterium]|nr:nucleotidyltransferase domain-containing protein [Anaerolineae bacterium]
MSNAEAAIEATLTGFNRSLGSQLKAAYLFGSFVQGYYQPDESDINLLFIVDDDADFFELRNAFLPVWSKVGDTLQRAPLFARVSAFSQYKGLEPRFAHHLHENGRLLLGSSDYVDTLPELDIQEATARLATEALTASGILIPSLMSAEQAAERLRFARRLARKLWQEPIAREETAVTTYARIQKKLGPQIARLPAGQAYTNTDIPSVTAPFLPGLQSLYKESDNIVMVLAHLSAQDILRTDWNLMTERLSEECTGLVLTTAAQLCLSLVYDTPIDLKTRRFQYNWGINHIAKLQSSKRQMMRQAAIAPARINIDSLPNALLTQNDDQFHTIIHDFQNKLLNVQLTHELLVRFGDVERFKPPQPLPDRSRPAVERLQGIFNHVKWWAEFYTEQMLAAQ